MAVMRGTTRRTVIGYFRTGHNSTSAPASV